MVMADEGLAFDPAGTLGPVDEGAAASLIPASTGVVEAAGARRGVDRKHWMSRCWPVETAPRLLLC
jgi:hypothetical protein